MNKELGLVTIVYGVEVHAFVLMPNHFHLMLTVPNFDLGKVMNYVMSNATRGLNSISGRSGHVFGGPHYRSLIETSLYFAHALKYVYRNPVKAGLASRAEAYPWSTLAGLVGNVPLDIPLYYPRSRHGENLVPKEFVPFLFWLNTPHPKEVNRLIQRGLTKKVFESLTDRRTKRLFEALGELT